jgi:hypothetical protein
MPDRHGTRAEVRPIYRMGDHVLVRLPNGLYGMEIRASEVIDGELWFYGRRGHFIGPFTAECVVRRLTPDEIRARPEPQ